MEIAGHVSRQMLSRYAHIRTEAKRKALEEVERKRAAAREQIRRLLVPQKRWPGGPKILFSPLPD